MLSSITYGRPVNGSAARLTTIGVVRTTESKTHKIGYETASAYTLVEVPAGEYEVVLSESNGYRCVLVRYAGIVTDDHYVNRLFTASSIAPKRGIGEERSCSSQHYPYIAAEAFATNPQWELAEDWTLASEQREYSDGRAYTAWSLIDPDGNVRR